MMDGRAVPWRVLAGAIAIACASALPSGLGAMQGASGGGADTGVVPPACKCTREAMHERHDNLVAFVTFKPRGQAAERDDLTGSVVWLCKHDQPKTGRDRVAWLNIAKGRREIQIKFRGGLWPFEEPEIPIIIEGGAVSDYFTVRADAPDGTYFYDVLRKNSADKPGVLVGILQPGPAVVVDN